uniref:Collectin sub-family member 11 n=1 Tax=Eptatretus burgeri TaxID=7764 RepID=A0A8C4N250_EPTBU
MYFSLCVTIYFSISSSAYQFLYLLINILLYQSIYFSVFLSFYQSMYLSIYLFISLSLNLLINLFLYLSIYFSIFVSFYHSLSFSITVVGMIESERRLYLLVREEKRFAEAKKHCQERGGWLAMPHDEVSNELLASYVTHGSSLGAYSRWQPGEPNNILGNENCVEMMSSGGWNNVDCSQGLYFVCEFEKLDTWPQNTYFFLF